MERDDREHASLRQHGKTRLQSAFELAELVVHGDAQSLKDLAGGMVEVYN